MFAAVLVAPGKEPRACDLADDVEGLQAIVGGYFELLARGFAGDQQLAIWCDEDGRSKRLALNRYLPGVGSIVGPIVLTGCDDAGELVSLDAEALAAVIDYAARWERL